MDSTTEMDNITKGIRAAGSEAVRKARYHNSKIISSKDGKMVEIDPHTIRLPEDLDKIIHPWHYED